MLVATEWSDTETGIQVQDLGVAFTSDGRQDEELDIRIGKAIATMRALHYSVAVKPELLKKSNAFNFWNSLCPFQARSQDLKKGGGGYFERVRSVQTTLTRIFIDLESVSDGLSEIWDEMSRKHGKFKGFFRPKLGEWFFGRNPKFKRFFRPKLGDLQKKTKNKKVFAEIQGDFSPNFRKFKRLRGGSFRMGGAIFHFSQKIGLKSTKYMRFCILHKPMGGGSSPPAPPLATLLVPSYLLYLLYGRENSAMTERVRLQVQASKIGFFKKIEGVTLLTSCASFAIRKSLEPLLVQIERSQLRCFDHVSKMPEEKLPNKLYLPKQMVKKNSWTTYNY